LKGLILYLAGSLSAHPEEASLEESPLPDGSTELRLSVHPEDLPALIGRNGRTIRAIRALMAIGSAKSGRRAVLSLDAPGGPLPGEGGAG
jgi:predicted RNA-binding protein YlqC (UPF0109 family)